MEGLGYWNDRWANGKTRWHMNEVNPILKRFSSRLGLTQPRRILIPLCGKSLDSLWFYHGGHQVVGVEGIEMAVKEFFEEHKLSHDVITLPWAKVYQTGDKRLQIYVCNFCDFKTEEVEKFDVVWDRGSIVAINSQDRDRYAGQMKYLMAPCCAYLLVTLQYEGLDINGGPPRSISHQLTEQLFGDFCHMELLEMVDVQTEQTKNVWGLKELWESVHLLTLKGPDPIGVGIDLE